MCGLFSSTRSLTILVLFLFGSPNALNSSLLISQHSKDGRDPEILHALRELFKAARFMPSRPIESSQSTHLQLRGGYRNSDVLRQYILVSSKASPSDGDGSALCGAVAARSQDADALHRYGVFLMDRQGNTTGAEAMFRCAHCRSTALDIRRGRPRGTAPLLSPAAPPPPRRA